MDVTIIGAGHMGRALATRFAMGKASVRLLGHGTKDDTAGIAQGVREAVPDAQIAVGLIGDPVDADVVILAVPFSAIPAIAAAYPDGFGDRVVVDITNPVAPDFEGLATPPGSSAAEQIAMLFPAARVVKAFNTTFASTVMAGQVSGQPIDVFIAADDAEAKAAVVKLANDGGLHTIDAGPLRRAHQLEELSYFHMTLQQSLGTGYGSTIKVVI